MSHSGDVNGESGKVANLSETHKCRSEAQLSTPDRIRTCDPRIRRPLLYPTELRGLAQTLSRIRRPSHATRCMATPNPRVVNRRSHAEGTTAAPILA